MPLFHFPETSANVNTSNELTCYVNLYAKNRRWGSLTRIMFNVALCPHHLRPAFWSPAHKSALFIREPSQTKIQFIKNNVCIRWMKRKEEAHDFNEPRAPKQKLKAFLKPGFVFFLIYSKLIKRTDTQRTPPFLLSRKYFLPKLHKMKITPASEILIPHSHTFVQH